jgi:hypothetical protein
MNYKEHLLARDLEGIGEDWVRWGLKYDPSPDWRLTAKCFELARDFEKVSATITAIWRRPDYEILLRMARADVVLHGSVSALVPEPHRRTILDTLDKYEQMGGRSVPRVGTFQFKEDSDLWDIQNELMDLPNALEQTWKVRLGTSPIAKHLDTSVYVPAPTYTSGAPSKFWRIPFGKHGVYPRKRGCRAAHCWDCPHACMTDDGVWGL